MQKQVAKCKTASVRSAARRRLTGLLIVQSHGRQQLPTPLTRQRRRPAALLDESRPGASPLALENWERLKEPRAEQS